MQEYLLFNENILGSLLGIKILPVTIVLLIMHFILWRYHLKTISMILVIITLIAPIPLIFPPLISGINVSQESGFIQPVLTGLSILIIMYIPALSSALLIIFLKKRGRKDEN